MNRYAELPPIGIMPRCIWEEKRFQELQEAIIRYVEKGYTISPKWVEEYNRFIKEHDAP